MYVLRRRGWAGPKGEIFRSTIGGLLVLPSKPELTQPSWPDWPPT